MSIEQIEGFRISPQQRRAWQSERNEQVSFCTVLIEGKIEIAALEKALSSVVLRHEILRTSFHTIAGVNKPLQRIDEEVSPSIDHYDLSDLRDELQKQQIESLVEKEVDFGAHLTAQVATLSPVRHILILKFSALCVDEPSFEIIVKELGLFYDSNIELESPLQYADAAAILNDFVESEETLAGRAFWQRTAPFIQSRTPFE
ncbi:MAG: hypothetical protein JNN15_18115, partial [Blastocatellia bacterium]|nr:hypothetical protein [Blastocatellia bacterium]